MQVAREEVNVNVMNGAGHRAKVPVVLGAPFQPGALLSSTTSPSLLAVTPHLRSCWTVVTSGFVTYFSKNDAMVIGPVQSDV